MRLLPSQRLLSSTKLKFIKTLILVSFIVSSKAQIKYSNQDILRSTLNKVFQAIKQLSVYRQQVDWNKSETQILKDATPYLKFENFKRSVKLLFLSIGDKHAFLFVGGMKISATDTPMTAIRSSLIHQLQSNHPQLHTEIIEDKYGYIFIPSNSTRDNLQLMAQAIQDSLCTLLKKPLNCIIIDLWANEGGSIYQCSQDCTS